MIEVMGWQYHIVYPGLTNFTECLRQNKNLGLEHFKGQGNTLYERLTYSPELEKVFQNSMQSLSKSANKILVSMVDFSGITHLVDAGGGDGTNAIEIAKANPTLKVSIFDSPSVCKIANANIQKHEMGSQVETHPGNFFTDTIPPGADCVLFCHMMTIWSLEKDTLLLSKIYNQLPEGGKVMLFNMMGNDAEDGPLSTALGSPYFLAIATGEGGLHSWKDYENVLSKAGFKQTERYELPKDHGVIIGIK